MRCNITWGGPDDGRRTTLRCWSPVVALGPIAHERWF